MSVNPVEPIGTYMSYYDVPLINATGTEHITRTEQLNSDGRTMTVSESVLTIYDRFENLVTIPNQRDQSTISKTV